MSNLKLSLVWFPLWFSVFILNVTSHPLVLPSAFFNQFDKLSEKSNPSIPYKVDYHIGSRFDPFKESLYSPDDYDGSRISPAKRAPTVEVLLPWEDDPEVVYLTEQPQNVTNNVTSASTSSSSSPSPSPSSNLSDQSPLTLSSSTRLSSTSIAEPNTTVSLLPWEEDSWQLFETTENPSSPNLTLITAPSTLKTPLIITITTSSTSPSATSGSNSSPSSTSLTSTSTVSSSSSTLTVETTTTFSPLPWEEDYFDNIASNQVQTTLGSTLRPYEPATTKLTTSQGLGTSSTTTRSTDLITISTNSESSFEESIFNLVPLKPVDNSDPNWPKFPNKRPKVKLIWL